MSNFNIHRWNADRRQAALNEGSTADKWYVIYTSPRGVNSKSYYRSEEEARKMAAAVHSYEDKGWQSTVMEPENLKEEFTKANFETFRDFMTAMSFSGGSDAFYKLPTQIKIDLLRLYAEELEDDRFTDG